MEIQVNLKRFRQEKKLTQTAAAEAIGIDQRQWNRYENGKNDIPVRYLKAICTKFKTSADWVLEIEDETGNKSIQKVIDDVISIIYWAAEQNHINEWGKEILLENIYEQVKGIKGVEFNG